MVKKINGKLYLYEVTDSYNAVTKKKQQSSRYLRKILPHEDPLHITREPLPVPAASDQEPQLKEVLSYGDAYLFHQLVEEIGLKKILLKCFSTDETHLLLIFVAFRL